MIKWNGRQLYPARKTPYKADINELMKPLSEKGFKGNLWGSVILNVEKEVETTPAVTPSNTPTPTITPSATANPTPTPSATANPTPTPTYTPSSTPLSYLLDLYSTDVYNAHSLRLLSSSYVGDAIRVRRDLDQAETDIGFIGQDLDIATLETFMSGSTRGYITTWYDQTGNGRDMEQATALGQAVIYESGAVLVDGNGKARAKFNGNAGNNNPNWYSNNSGIATANLAVFAVAERNTTSGVEFTLWTSSDPLLNNDATNKGTPILTTELNNVADTLGTFNNWVSYTGQVTVSQSPDSITEPFIGTYDRSGTTVTITSVSANVNVTNSGTQTWSSSPTGNNKQAMGLSGTIAGVNCWAGYIQEMVVYDQSKTTSASGIKTNMNSYYGIY